MNFNIFVSIKLSNMSYFSKEKNICLVLDLLKAHGVKKVISSPGATNTSIVASMQNDDWFEMYSSVDERSAAYMACGLAEESGEPVVISCTGATASRNYFPGLTEAFYRKLPIICITSSQNSIFIGHLYQQLTDRTSYPKDIFVAGEQIQWIKDDMDYWDCENKINKVLLACKRNGGGPVHLNIQNNAFAIENVDLTKCRVISRYTVEDKLPQLPMGQIGIFISSHKKFSQEETEIIDAFCASHDAAVFCEKTSGYYGRYRVDFAIAGFQKQHKFKEANLDLLIHVGEMTADYQTSGALNAPIIWRVSEDGEIRVKFKHLEAVFQMKEKTFFSHYITNVNVKTTNFVDRCREICDSIRLEIPDLPLSNVWCAKVLSPIMPNGSIIHLGILNSYRSWNMFSLSPSIHTMSNVGGFGIDGCTSTLIGASLANTNKIHYLITGDLAFFYDLNAIGNHHIGGNVRILLINNGLGGEFKIFGRDSKPVDVDKYIAAAGHYGNKSKKFVQHMAQDLGFKYLSASTKEEFLAIVPEFTNPAITEKPMIVEVFEDIKDQDKALYLMQNIVIGNVNDQIRGVKNKLSKVKKMFKA